MKFNHLARFVKLIFNLSNSRYTFKEESGRERNVIFVPPREEDEDEGEDEERRKSAQKTPRRLPRAGAVYR